MMLTLFGLLNGHRRFHDASGFPFIDIRRTILLGSDLKVTVLCMVWCDSIHRAYHGMQKCFKQEISFYVKNCEKERDFDVIETKT